MDYGLGWSIGLKRVHKVGCFLSKKLTKWYFLHFLSWLSPIFGTGILMMTFVQTAGVLLPNGSHRSCCKRIFIFVKIFKKYFFCFYIYISTPTAGVFLSSNIYLWKDIQKVFLVFLLFFIFLHTNGWCSSAQRPSQRLPQNNTTGSPSPFTMACLQEAQNCISLFQQITFLDTTLS